MPFVERSFAITFPRDVSHIRTAGDLLDQVLAMRIPTGEGVKCDSSMVFYRLRRHFARENPSCVVRSQTPLSKLTSLTPKALSKQLARDTGLAMPQVEPSNFGCLMSISTPIASLAIWYLVDARAFAIVAVLCTALLHSDRGGFRGAWRDVGSLAYAIARLNVAKLADEGARDRPEDWWRQLQQLLADAAEPVQGERRPLMAKRIGRGTRIELY